MILSVIIVNFRSSRYVLDALETAFRFESARSFEWIVVDNHSEDNSRAHILLAFPQVKWIQMDYNAGFSRANNEGIRQSSGEIVLLLNPDTLIKEDAINQCLLRFLPSPFIACGVQLLFPDGGPQISGNYFMKGGLNHLLPLPYWGSFLKAIAQIFQARKPSIELAAEEERVDWINGAFMMVRKSAIEKAGLMDEDFFLYAEEIEWCSRLAKHGQLCIFGDIHIVHIQGESINSASGTSDKGYFNLYDKKGLQLMVSNHVRIRKQYGTGWFLFQLVNYSIAVPVFIAGTLLKGVFHSGSTINDWKKIKGFSRNILQLWKLAPVIIKNKPYFYKIL